MCLRQLSGSMGNWHTLICIAKSYRTEWSSANSLTVSGVAPQFGDYYLPAAKAVTRTTPAIQTSTTYPGMLLGTAKFTRISAAWEICLLKLLSSYTFLPIQCPLVVTSAVNIRHYLKGLILVVSFTFIYIEKAPAIQFPHFAISQHSSTI